MTRRATVCLLLALTAFDAAGLATLVAADALPWRRRRRADVRPSRRATALVTVADRPAEPLAYTHLTPPTLYPV